MPQRFDPPTLPTPLPGSHLHAEPLPDGARASAARPAGLSMPLGTLAMLFMAGSVAVAALLGFGLAAWLQPAQPWMVGLAAAVGVLCTALPLAVALVGLARRAEWLPGGALAAGAGSGVAADGASQGLVDRRGAGHGFASSPRSGPNAAAASGTGAGAGAGTAQGQAAARIVPGAQGMVLSREHFVDMVGREWSRSRRYGTGAALLLVEIDRYPRLVEALSEVAGEKVLADLLAATAPTLRGADALARYGVGQFAVFLAHADATGALDVAERIRERAEQMEVAVPPRRVRFTVGVGVAHLRPAHLHLQALIDDVIDALAAARAAGGNCVRAAPVEIGPRPSPGGAARDGSRADKK